MLLKENGAAGLDGSTVQIAAEGAEAPPGEDVRSPETYAGYAPRGELRIAGAHGVRITKGLQPANQARIKSVGARRIVERQRRAQRASNGARQGGFLTRPAHGARPIEEQDDVRFKIMLNGAAPGRDHGSDANADGVGEIRQSRMYQLIRQEGLIKDRL